MKKKVKNSHKIRKKVEHENRRHTLIHEDLLHNMTLKKGKIVEIPSTYRSIFHGK